MRPQRLVQVTVALVSLLLLSTGVGLARPATQGGLSPVVRGSSRNDTSAPLRTIAPIAPRTAERKNLRLSREEDTSHEPGVGGAPGSGAIDNGSAVNGRMPGTIRNFEGVPNVNGSIPPDTNGDVGPNHYVQTVNLAFAIWNKSGNLLYGPANINTLFSGFGGPCETTNDGDPIVQYDHLADRWMISQFALPFDFGPFFQCIAVSQTGDPTGAYYRYQFTISDTKLNDYPKFGVWPDAYYMSVNQYIPQPGGGYEYAGAGAVAFERAKMLAGQPARMVYFDEFTLNPDLGGQLPSDLDGQAPPAGTPNYFAEVDDDLFGLPYDQLQVFEFRVNWSNPALSSFSGPQVIQTAPFDINLCNFDEKCIPQKNSGQRLDTLADRLMYRLQYRNFGSYQTLVTNHSVDVDGNDHAGVRWYELRKTGTGAWGVRQQGTWAPDATNRWMGSAAMDKQGNIAIGYSVSSLSLYPGIRYAGRLAGDPLGKLTKAENSIVEGGGSQIGSFSRWGDYSSMSIDPDGCTFWYTNEYYPRSAGIFWHTRVGSFKFPSCS